MGAFPDLDRMSPLSPLYLTGGTEDVREAYVHTWVNGPFFIPLGSSLKKKLKVCFLIQFPFTHDHWRVAPAIGRVAGS